MTSESPSETSPSPSGSKASSGTTSTASAQTPLRNAHNRSITPSGLTLHRPEFNHDAVNPDDVTPTREEFSDRDAGRQKQRSSLTTTPSASANAHASSSSATTPLAETMAPTSRLGEESLFTISESFHSKRSIRWDPSSIVDSRPSIHDILTESTPLLRNNLNDPPPNYTETPPSFAETSIAKAKHILSPQNVEDTLKTAVKSLPAVLLGSLLNILDGISCACSPHPIHFLLLTSSPPTHRRHDHLPRSRRVCRPWAHGSLDVFPLVSIPPSPPYSTVW